MIQYKLKNTNTINAEGTKVFLEDITGEYDAITNPTGYGGINPTRDSVAIYITGVNRTTKGDKFISFEPYSPLTDSTYTALIPTDGWYEFSLNVLTFYDSNLLNTDYNAGEIYYNVATGKVLKIVQDIYYPPVGAPEIFNKAEVISIVDIDYLHLYAKSTVDTFFTSNNAKIKLQLNSKVSDLILTDTDYSNKVLIRHKDNYNSLRAVLQGAIYEYMRGNKYVAQASMEFLNTNNYLKS